LLLKILLDGFEEMTQIKEENLLVLFGFRTYGTLPRLIRVSTDILHLTAQRSIGVPGFARFSFSCVALRASNRSLT
jgi:hypothetical protein